MYARRLGLLLAAALMTACASITINDDGTAQVSIDGCDGIDFNIIVAQTGAPGRPNKQEGNVVPASGGKISFKLRDPGKFDFTQDFTITLVASGPINSDSCKFGTAAWEFTGKLVVNKGIFEDTTEVQLKEFHKK